MATTRIECPECGAGLKSPSGFTAGESVECPKCETTFTVEEPEAQRPVKSKKPVRAVASRAADNDDDEIDDKPRKKKKKREEDDEDEDDKRSYKTSPMRFVILGVLVVVMIVLGVLLFRKKQAEKEEAKTNDDPPANVGGPPANLQGPGAGGNLPRPIPPVPLGGPAKGPTIGVLNPGGPGPIGGPGGIRPVQPGLGGVEPAPGRVGDFGGPAPAFGSIEGKQIVTTLCDKLLGSWEGIAPDGSTHKVTYQAGQYTHEVSGGKGSSKGAWLATGLIGSKGLKLNRTGTTIRVVFEDDELIHDTATPGESVVLRKK